VLLTDITGTEDHYGDMDFKIAGSRKGITAMQLDVKLSDGVPSVILEEALDHARIGRLQILDAMTVAQKGARPTVKDTAPKAAVVVFDPERKVHLIGRGGEMLRFIEENYQCEVDINEDGVAYIYGGDARNVSDARMLVQDLVALIAEGDLFSAEVIKVEDFGAIVKIARAQEALLHVSEISHDPLVQKKIMSELLVVGQRLDIQVLTVDKATGLMKVSRKSLIDPFAHLVTPDNLIACPPEVIVPSSSSGKNPLGPNQLPTFSVVPPRRWDRAYFKNNVAKTEDELKIDIEEKKARNAAEMQKIRDAKNELKQTQPVKDKEISIDIDEISDSILEGIINDIPETIEKDMGSMDSSNDLSKSLKSNEIHIEEEKEEKQLGRVKGGKKDKKDPSE